MIIHSSDDRFTAALAAVFLTLALSACPGGGNGGGTPVTPTDVSQLYVSGLAGRVLVYNDANTASGSTLPNRTIAGGLTTLNNPRGIAVDMARNHLYVANYSNNSILVFHNARSTSGGSTPNRTITGAPLGGSSALFVDPVGDRLFVANTVGNSILIYDNASSLNGNVAPSRTLSGVATALSAPIGLFVDTTRNLMYVANGDNRILIYANAAGATGNTPPTRIIAGLSGVGGIFVDVLNDRIFLAAIGANAILIYDGASLLSGSPAPSRTISGAATQLNQPRDLFADVGTDRLYIINAGTNSVLVFNVASSGNGNVAPNRVLTLTAATNPWGVFVDVTPLAIGSSAGLDGFISFDGTTHTATSNGGSPRTGDDEAFLTGNRARQFFSFDLSGIPTNITLNSATLRLYQASQTGTPYNDLGTVVLDHVDYGASLDGTPGDFEGGLIELLGVFATDATIGYRTRDVTARVANDLANARSRSQFRMRFAPQEINTDFNSDFAQFTDAEDSCCSVSRPPQLSLILRP